MLFKYEILTMTQNVNHLFFLPFLITSLFLLFWHLSAQSQQWEHYNKLLNIFKVKGAAMQVKKLLMNCVIALRVWRVSWEFRILNIYKFVVIPPGE